MNRLVFLSFPIFPHIQTYISNFFYNKKEPDLPVQQLFYKYFITFVYIIHRGHSEIFFFEFFNDFIKLFF